MLAIYMLPPVIQNLGNSASQLSTGTQGKRTKGKGGKGLRHHTLLLGPCMVSTYEQQTGQNRHLFDAEKKSPLIRPTQEPSSNSIRISEGLFFPTSGKHRSSAFEGSKTASSQSSGFFFSANLSDAEHVSPSLSSFLFPPSFLGAEIFGMNGEGGSGGGGGGGGGGGRGLFPFPLFQNLLPKSELAKGGEGKEEEEKRRRRKEVRAVGMHALSISPSSKRRGGKRRKKGGRKTTFGNLPIFRRKLFFLKKGEKDTVGGEQTGIPCGRSAIAFCPPQCLQKLCLSRIGGGRKFGSQPFSGNSRSSLFPHSLCSLHFLSEPFRFRSVWWPYTDAFSASRHRARTLKTIDSFFCVALRAPPYGLLFCLLSSDLSSLLPLSFSRMAARRNLNVSSSPPLFNLELLSSGGRLEAEGGGVRCRIFGRELEKVAKLVF